MAQALGSVFTQTVSDVLAACTAASLVRRIELAEVVFEAHCLTCQALAPEDP